MKKKCKLIWKLGIIALVLSIYPLFVLIYTWTSVFASDLEGGRHGPLDAYRHALASAVVSYTLGERAVALTSALMESKGKDSNRMDEHNNRIGANIGARARFFREIAPAVRQAVLDGNVNSNDQDRITWLPEEKWRSLCLW